MVIVTTFPPPTEGILRQEANTEAHMRGQFMGNGTLYIAESRLSWVSQSGDGFSLEYPAIALHGVSRDTTAFPQECLYLMLDGSIEVHRGEGDSALEDGESQVSEVRFIPQDKSSLAEMYQAMCTCQALHPDPNDSASGDDDDDAQFFEDADEGASHLSAEGQQVLQRLDNLLTDDAGIEMDTANGIHTDADQMTTEQFEDADVD